MEQETPKLEDFMEIRKIKVGGSCLIVSKQWRCICIRHT